MTTPPPRPLHALLASVLDELYAAEAAAVRGRAEADFARPTRAEAWTVRELLFHQLLDAQRALVALASHTDGPADVDAFSYWRPFRTGAGWAADHARFVQVGASAYPSGAVLLDQFVTTTEAAARAVDAADPMSRVRTQGHVIHVADLTSSLVVEATVHLLDLTVDLDGAPAPSPAALAEARRVLEGIYGRWLPTRWDDTEAVLKGTGRAPLTEEDRAGLRDQGAAFPLLA